MSIFNYREQPGYFKRMKDAFQVTAQDINHQLSRLTGTAESPITEEQIEDLEETLLGADMGVQTTEHLLGKIREATAGDRFITRQQVKRLIRRELLQILGESEGPLDRALSRKDLSVVFVVGVNGVGKTTTIGKLARLYQGEGKKVLFSASDTFRAAAVEQLEIWGERTQSPVIKQSPGADPAAVLFDAIAAGRARAADIVIVDTAGRIHTKSNLMQELEKMSRVASREIEDGPHEVFMVLDATTGQNGLVQAREFLRSSGVTGLIVTKLDGTAKGGILIAIARELHIPIRYIGVGEKVEDLLVFDPEAYIDTLLQIGDQDR
jgi:fused signal recognition particle receptor